jgi:AcrR family transcriptional regulator
MSNPVNAQKTAINKPDQQDILGNPKERILQVALELFTKLGYEATSIDDIREAAGFRSKASLYAHFKSKQAISENLKKRILEQIQRELFAAYETAAPDPVSQFFEVMRAYIKWGFTHRQEFAFRIIRAQEERMEKGEYDWQRDLEQSKDRSSVPKNIYTLILGIIQQLRSEEYPVRQIPEAALFHMMIGAISRAVIDRDSFGKVAQSEENVDWTEQVNLTLESCMGILFKEAILF